MKVFDKGFYYGLGIASIVDAILNICTQQKFYLGRALTWLIIEGCLIYCNYIILKHIYITYDVIKWVLPSRFRLDSMPSDHDNIGNMPPLTINANANTNTKSSAAIKETTATSRNIKSILRIQNGGSLNNSPVSMSMARMFMFSVFMFVYIWIFSCKDNYIILL